MGYGQPCFSELFTLQMWDRLRGWPSELSAASMGTLQGPSVFLQEAGVQGLAAAVDNLTVGVPEACRDNSNPESGREPAPKNSRNCHLPQPRLHRPSLPSEAQTNYDFPPLLSAVPLLALV